MKKKLLSLLLASVTALSVAGGLAACDNGTGGGGENYSGELTVWCPDNARAGYEALVAKHEEFNDVTITWVSKGEGDAKADITNDPEKGADVFFTEGGAIPTLVEQNIMQPLVGQYASYAEAVKNRDSEGSVGAITLNNICYGFPATADNTWFMMYNSEYFPTAPTNFDQLVAKAAELGKKVYFKYNDGWYLSSFFFGAGCRTDFDVAEDGTKTYFTDVHTSEGGKIAGKAIINYFGKNSTNSSVFVTEVSDFNSEVTAALNDGTAVAGFIGTWVMQNIENENIKYAMVPKYTVDGSEYQLRPFYTAKYCGVNAKRTNKAAAVALANLLTSEEGQMARYAASSSLPTNKNVANTADVKADPVSFIADQNLIGYVQGEQPNEMYASLTTFANNTANGTITLENLQTHLNTLAEDSFTGDTIL